MSLYSILCSVAIFFISHNLFAANIPNNNECNISINDAKNLIIRGITSADLMKYSIGEEIDVHAPKKINVYLYHCRVGNATLSVSSGRQWERDRTVATTEVGLGEKSAIGYRLIGKKTMIPLDGTFIGDENIVKMTHSANGYFSLYAFKISPVKISNNFTEDDFISHLSFKIDFE